MKYKDFETLSSNMEFKNIYNKRISYANKDMIMYISKNGTDTKRLGVSVSKKVGNSIVRHRLTRLIRESVRLNSGSILKGYDIVIIARVVITEYSVLHHSIKGEKITLDNPNPEIAIPVAKPLCSLNHNISVFTGDKYPMPSPIPIIQP